MAALGLLVRQGVAFDDVNVSVVTLADRRPNAPSEPRMWTFQREVEAALYGNGFACQSGAVTGSCSAGHAGTVAKKG
eukprot:1603155-Prymnesium_polylepis.1